MPYRKRRRFGRRFRTWRRGRGGYRRRGYRSTSRGRRWPARRSCSLSRKINSSYSPQFNTLFSDINAWGMNTLDTKVLYPLYSISEGTGNADRLGKKILLRSYECRGFFVMPRNDVTEYSPTTTETTYKINTPGIFSIMILYDKQYRRGDAIPSWTDVYNDPNHPFDYREVLSRGRFRILAKKSFNTGCPWGMQRLQYFRIKWRGRLPCRFTTTGTDSYDTGFFVLCRYWNDSGEAKAPLLTIDFWQRIVWNNCV